MEVCLCRADESSKGHARHTGFNVRRKGQHLMYLSDYLIFVSLSWWGTIQDIILKYQGSSSVLLWAPDLKQHLKEQYIKPVKLNISFLNSVNKFYSIPALLGTNNCSHVVGECVQYVEQPVQVLHRCAFRKYQWKSARSVQAHLCVAQHQCCISRRTTRLFKLTQQVHYSKILLH